MHQNIKLTDAEIELLGLVAYRFIVKREPVPRRPLVVKFQDPDILESLITRGFLRDCNRQAVLPTLLTFHFCNDLNILQLARESLQTILHVLRAFFLETEEENKQITPEEIGDKAVMLRRPVGPDTVWLGLYFIQSFFGIMGSSMGGSNQADLPKWLTVSEGVLKFKDIDNAWESRIQQELQWQTQRDSYVRPIAFQEFDDDSDTISKSNLLREEMSKGILIFISHSSKDGDIALSLIELLRAALGLTDEQIRCTSVDGFRLPSGANVDDVLKAEVLSAEAFIGLITPNSVASAYVLFELGARWGAQRHMVPVLAGLGPEALQGPLKGINSISAYRIAQLHQLLSDLSKTLQLDLQSAASYTRYAEKLVNEIKRVHGTPTSDLLRPMQSSAI